MVRIKPINADRALRMKSNMKLDNRRLFEYFFSFEPSEF